EDGFGTRVVSLCKLFGRHKFFEEKFQQLRDHSYTPNTELKGGQSCTQRKKTTVVCRSYGCRATGVTMCSSSANIHFDYDGNYSKSGDDYELIPTDGRLYDIYFKTPSLKEITYSLLKEMICRKMGIDPYTKMLKFSYIPLVVEPKRQSYILDDEDDIKELEIVSITEQLSRVEKENSYGMNYSASESGYGEAEEHKEHP
ncbi:unnamed protein product, partial [Brassica oleracea var. botrytis]